MAQTKRAIALLIAGLVALLAGNSSQSFALAGPAPVVDSVAPLAQALKPTTPTEESQQQQENLVAVGATTTTTNNNNNKQALSSKAGTLINGNGGEASQSGAKGSARLASRSPLSAANSEKLRRGLTNFMNNLNPAQFFVPPQQQQPLMGSGKTKGVAPMGSGTATAAAAAAAANQAEPATIVTHGLSADALIKGPNRLVQSRPLGGPLRWGRRR